MKRVLALVLLLAAQPAAAFDMSRSGDQQIQVYADNGIEWQSDATRVIATGNAKAVRGTMTVTADTLTAYYRKGPKGDEIWRLDADGNVTIASPTETATGYKGIYDLDKAVFVLHGRPAKLVTPTESYTANDTIEYWENERMAVLRGKAVAVQADKTLKGDVLTAHFLDREEAKGKTLHSGKGGTAKKAEGGGGLQLQRADAYGNVVIITATEEVTGDRGDYNVETGIATVSGSVKIVREDNQLNGGFAHVDLNTGVSKLFGTAPGGRDGGQRVQGLFVPEKKDMDSRRAVFRGSAPTRPDGGSQPQTGR
ncbi:MAG: LptA/OstA family protein [Actinomycetota bacterium]